MVEAQKQIEGTKKLYFSWSLHDYDVRNEGREETRRETARNMLADGLSREKIAQYTGLSLAEVEELSAGQG